MTVEQVDELWTENFYAARVALTRESMNLLDGGLKRLLGKACRLADEQTKRQIRDADAWQRFTNQRARPQGRPSDKKCGLFDSQRTEQRLPF